jgi:hypothetical protein
LLESTLLVCGLLCRSAVKILAVCFEALTDEDLVLGVIAAIQTFGEGVNFRPEWAVIDVKHYFSWATIIFPGSLRSRALSAKSWFLGGRPENALTICPRNGDHQPIHVQVRDSTAAFFAADIL